MAKLTIEIDTGVLNKLDGGRTSHSVLTIRELRHLVKEANERLKRMGVDADGVVLYSTSGPRGRITLTESDQRTDDQRNWYDETVSAGVPISDRRDETLHRDVKIYKKGDPNVCGNWHWENTRTGTVSRAFPSAQAALDHARDHE